MRFISQGSIPLTCDTNGTGHVTSTAGEAHEDKLKEEGEQRVAMNPGRLQSRRYKVISGEILRLS